MPGLGVLLLSFAVWLIYCGSKGLRPIATGRAILADPNDSGKIIAGAVTYAQQSGAKIPVIDNSASGLTMNSTYQGVTVGTNPWASLSVTAPYGQASHAGTFGAAHIHQGIDYAMPSGTALPALFPGTAHHVGNSLGGNILRVDGSGPYKGWSTFYDHVREYKASDGQKVDLGQIVALSGGAAGDPGRGDATGAHLHFEVHHNGAVVNPSQLFLWENTNIKNLTVSGGGYQPGNY